MGEGRFGTVFEAEFCQKANTDTVDGIGMKKCKNDKNSTKPISEKEKIAVKMLKKKSVIDQESVMQIIEEIRIHSVCSGLPHVLKFFKAWQSERHLFVALSLCQRGSLADLFQTRKMPFSSQSVILAANQLYQGEEQNFEGLQGIVFKTKAFWIQLNEYETDQYFLQNFQCTTMLIHMFCKICEHEIVLQECKSKQKQVQVHNSYKTCE